MIKSQADRAWRDDRWMSAIRGEFNRSLLVWLIVVSPRWFFNEVPDWAVISRHRHPAVAEEVVE